MKSGPGNPWIIRRRPRPQAALRLVCFPYAGAGASVFRTWPDALPGNVELLAIELPGRESRLKERAFDRLPPLIAALTDAVAPMLQAPFAVFGHSFGALVGFSFARELRRRSFPGPVHLFVSGRRPPQLPEPPSMHELPDPEFLAGLRRLGGIPDAVFHDPEIMQLFLPILRADFTANETARTPHEPPLGCPISALGGLTDDRASAGELDAWRVQTTAAFEREIFAGGHFFLQTEHAGVLAWLSSRLAQITAAL
jgi:medium-chain acyl-[acyl-carrier-protein] hydrolase